MRRGSLLVAAVAMALTAVGCGSDGGGETGTAKDASNPDLPVVKVGMIAPIGTPNTDLKEGPAGLSAAIRALNARGGLNGHRVEMVFCNDKDDPNEGVRCARRMVEEKVAAVAGSAGGSVVQDKVIPVLQKAGIPVIGSDSSTPVGWNAPNMYMTAQPAPFNYDALIAYAVKNDLLPMAVAAADNPAGLQFADFLEATLKKLSGQGFARVVPVADNTADYAPIAGALTEGDAKSVLNIIGTQQQLGVGRALDGVGSEAVLLTAAPLSVEQLSDAGPNAGRIVMAGAYPPFDSPAMGKFRDDMAAEAAAGNKDASLQNASAYAAYGWVALQVLELVTEGMDTLTPQSISKALDEAKDVDLGGIFPPWTPGKPGPEGFGRVSNASTWFAGFDNGKTEALVDAAVGQKDLIAQSFEAQLPPVAR